MEVIECVAYQPDRNRRVFNGEGQLLVPFRVGALFYHPCLQLLQRRGGKKAAISSQFIESRATTPRNQLAIHRLSKITHRKSCNNNAKVKQSIPPKLAQFDGSSPIEEQCRKDCWTGKPNRARKPNDARVEARMDGGG
jgi:hypothetical protein